MPAWKSRRIRPSEAIRGISVAMGINELRIRAVSDMKEPTLVIMAAGMGSRFGGLKQITAVDAEGHAIIDFSLFDAYRASS